MHCVHGPVHPGCTPPQALNLILLTSPEVRGLREALAGAATGAGSAAAAAAAAGSAATPPHGGRGAGGASGSGRVQQEAAVQAQQQRAAVQQQQGAGLFAALYPCWAHSPGALLSLCLLAQVRACACGCVVRARRRRSICPSRPPSLSSPLALGLLLPSCIRDKPPLVACCVSHWTAAPPRRRTTMHLRSSSATGGCPWARRCWCRCAHAPLPAVLLRQCGRAVHVDDLTPRLFVPQPSCGSLLLTPLLPPLSPPSPSGRPAGEAAGHAHN